jgi:hypothetical protein
MKTIRHKTRAKDATELPAVIKRFEPLRHAETEGTGG